jgi:ADP-heptose:LPS heptosyltransferase
MNRLSVIAEKMLLRESIFIKKKTLLLVRLDSIGDYILFRNFIQSLKESGMYREYRITLCGNIWWKELAEELDKQYISKFIWIDYNRMSEWKYRLRKYFAIHSKGFEVVIHPTFSRDEVSDGIVIHSGAKIKIGSKGDTRNLSADEKNRNDKYYSMLIACYEDKTGFEFYRNRDFFQKLLSEKIALSKPEIPVAESEENVIVICPGAKSENRQWAPSHFAKLCGLIHRQHPGIQFMICGSAADTKLSERIKQYAELQFVDRTGRESLAHVAGILSKARLIITNDSGPFHLAVALNKKVICLSNGNNLGRFTPYPDEMKTESVVFYPDEVVARINDKEFITSLQKRDSWFDINSIQPEIIFKAIVDNGWI